MVHQYNWRHLLTVPRCHKWFSGNDPRCNVGVSACDYSGKTPCETEDGPLWLVIGQVIMLETAVDFNYYDSFEEQRLDFFRGSVVHSLDAIRDDGSETQIGGTSPLEVLHLSNFGFINVEFKDFKGTRTRVPIMDLPEISGRRMTLDPGF